MIQPEDDFLTWLEIVASIAESPSDFEPFVPDIVRLFDSIKSTNELPDPIKGWTTTFLERLPFDVTRKFLRLRMLDDESRQVVEQYLKAAINFSSYGITRDPPSLEIAQWPLQIALSPNAGLFEAEYRLQEALKKYIKECGYFDAAKLALKKGVETIASLSLYYDVLVGCLAVLPEEQSFWEFSNDMLVSLLVLCKANLRAISHAQIRGLFDTGVNYASKLEYFEPTFVSKWFELLLLCIESEFFEKRLLGYRGIVDLIRSDSVKPAAIEFFADSERVKLFNGANLRNEFIEEFGKIVSFLASARLFGIDQLTSLWQLHAVQNESLIAPFFGVFCKIVAVIPAEDLRALIELVLSPARPSLEWVKFLGLIAKELGRRGDAEAAFGVVRDALFAVSSDLQPAAEEQLSSILHFYLSPTVLEGLIGRLSANGFSVQTFRLLVEPVCVQEFETAERAIELLTIALNYVLANEQGRDILYGFIFNIASTNKIQIPEDKLDPLFALYDKCEFFYPFAKSLLNPPLVPFAFVAHFIQTFPIDAITFEFYSLVEVFINCVNSFAANSIVISTLPLVYEELLWQLSSKRSIEHVNFCQYLAYLYSLNDGTRLSDYQMINFFIRTWQDYVGRPNVDTECLLILLRSFIQSIENDLDVSLFNLKRHDPSYETQRISVTVMHCSRALVTLNLPESMTVAGLQHRVSKIVMMPMGAFILRGTSEIAKPTETLKAVAKGKSELKISVMPVSEEACTFDRHDRTCIPSVAIAQSSVVNVILESLKENSAEAKKLLGWLPTLPAVELKIREIAKKRSFDYSELLPVDSLTVFQYNFESLRGAFNDDLRTHLKRTGGFEYLIRNVSEVSASYTIPFLDDALTPRLKLEFGQLILDSLYPLLAKIETETAFNLVITFIRGIAEIEGATLVLPEKEYPTVAAFLFSPLVYVRTQSALLFSHLQIPLSVFQTALPNLTKQCEVDFFVGLLPHVTEYNSDLLNTCLGELHSTAYLSVLEKLLEFAPPHVDEIVLPRLIPEFLEVNDRPRDVATFAQAVRCIGKLQTPTLYAHLCSLHEGRGLYVKWGIDGDATTVSPTGWSGLVNLGATCFLASTLQQFFAIVPLRNTILGYSKEDPFVLELRNLFARLLLSKGHSVSPSRLVEQWTGWDGAVMNPRVQQDASDFTQMLISKLENGLDKAYVENLFAGTNVDTIEGITEEYHTTREEPHKVLTLPINDCTTTEAAFVKFQAPDFLTGGNQYKAESLGRKIDAKKFASLGKLPPILIVQLGRFTYDFVTWAQIKIDTPVRFPIDLDLSSYVAIEFKDQPMRYRLTGFVVHSGTLEAGHYISLVRHSDSWLLFNDAHVSSLSEEMALKIGYGQVGPRTAYLLFYQRIDFNNVAPDPVIPDDLQIEVSKENHLNDEYRLFCSSGYFELAKILANSELTHFNEIAFRYFFDSFPFTTHLSRTAELAAPLLRRLQASQELQTFLADFLTEGPFVCALVYCSANDVRGYAHRFIKTAAVASEGFIKRLLHLLEEDVVPYYACLDDYFQTVLHLASHAVMRELADGARFSRFLTDDIPRYLLEHKELRAEYFYGGFPLSGLLKVIAEFGPTDEAVNHVLAADFLRLLLGSRTDLDAIATFLAGQPRARPFFEDFLTHASLQVSCFRLLPLAFALLGLEAFTFARQAHLKVGDNRATDFDIACVICSRMQESPAFTELLFQNLDQWFLQILLSENEEARIVARHIVTLFVPHDSFQPYICFPPSSHQKEFRKFEVVFRPTDDEILTRARRITEFICESRAAIVAKTLTMKGRSLNLPREAFTILRILNDITGLDVVEFANAAIVEFLPVMTGFGVVVKELFEYLVAKGSALITTEFIMKMFPQTIDDSRIDVTQKVLILVETISPYIPTFEPPREFVERTIVPIAFPRARLGAERLGHVKKYIERVRILFPDILLKCLDNEFPRILKSHYSALLITLEALDLKSPILDGLCHAAASKQFVGFSELIVRSFDRHEGPIEDVLALIGLLNNPETNGEARARIWALIEQEKPTLAAFNGVYSWKGDWEQLATYLIKFDSGQTDQLLECAQNSIVAFTIAYPWLSAHLPDALASISAVILKMEIGGHEDIVIEYLRSLLARKSDAEEVFAPLVSAVILRVRFLASVLADPAEGGLTASDVVPLFGPLRVLAQFKPPTIAEELAPLNKALDGGQLARQLGVPELEELAELIAACLA